MFFFCGSEMIFFVYIKWSFTMTTRNAAQEAWREREKDRESFMVIEWEGHNIQLQQVLNWTQFHATFVTHS
jgi:hypothetical protein